MISPQSEDSDENETMVDNHHSVSYGSINSPRDEDYATENSTSVALLTKSSKPVGLRLRLFPLGFKYELQCLLYIAIPMILTNFFQFTILTVSNVMCGHLSKVQFDGASLANSIINAFGMSVGLGLCTASDTLFAQAYGSPYKRRVGLFLQRGLIINSLAPILLWILHLNIEPVLILLRQDPEVASLAAQYMKWFLPGLLFQFDYLILARYMQNQNRVLPPLAIGILGNVFNLISQYIAIYVLGFGIVSSALCQAGAYLVMLIAAIIYIVGTKFYRETWAGWSWESLFDWDNFLALAIPGVGHVALECVCYEIVTFIAGGMGNTELGANSIVSQIDCIAYMFGLGIGIATNIRVGQYLGANNPESAKLAVRVGIIVCGVFSISFAIIYVGMKDILPKFFTNDKEVIELASAIIPIIPLVTLGDNFLAVWGGALRGCGQQKIGAIIVFLGYNVLGIPIGIILAFVAEMGIIGLWLGIAAGVFLCQLMIIFVLYKQDWQEEANKARFRLIGIEIPVETNAKRFTESTRFFDSKTISDQVRRLAVNMRTPSQPYGCSIEVPHMPPVRGFIPRRQVAPVLRKRIITLCIIIFLFGVSIVFYELFPKRLYLPVINNATVTTGPTTNITMFTTISPSP